MEKPSEPAPVVVGTDGSAYADHAIRWAAAEARRWDAPLHIVHVWSVPVTSWPYAGTLVALAADDTKSVSEGIVAAAAEALHARMGEATPPVEARSLEGRPAHRLLELGATARTLVLGTRGRGGFRDLLIGSVAAACMHHTRSPLVLVGHDVDVSAPGPIVVGVDGSEGARRALRWGAVEAARSGVGLSVIHGWDQPAVTPPGPAAPGPLGGNEASDSADRLVYDMVAEELQDLDPRPEIDASAVSAHPADALITASESASLLVVGTRGRGGFSGLLLGSVSQQVAAHARCPVAVIPSPRT